MFGSSRYESLNLGGEYIPGKTTSAFSSSGVTSTVSFFIGLSLNLFFFVSLSYMYYFRSMLQSTKLPPSHDSLDLKYYVLNIVFGNPYLLLNLSNVFMMIGGSGSKLVPTSLVVACSSFKWISDSFVIR